MFVVYNRLAMNRLVAAAVVLGLAAFAAPAFAHPAPFSYIDLRIGPGALDVDVVAHVFDVAHDLQVGDFAQLLTPSFAEPRAARLRDLLQPRFSIAADGQPVACAAVGGVEIVAERQSLKTHFTCRLDRAPGMLAVHALMFPYDANHQTFLNVYERGTLATQAILDAGHTTFEYYSGTRQGVWAVVKKFVPAGIHHILIGPDHLLFLVGLLLLGGTVRQLARRRHVVHGRAQRHAVARGAQHRRRRRRGSSSRRSRSASCTSAPTTCWCAAAATCAPGSR